MKHFSPSGSVRLFIQTLALTGSVLLIPVTEAPAASWQWSSRNGRERIVLELDAPRQAGGAARTGTTELTVGFETPPASFARNGAAPDAGSLVSGVQAGESGVRVLLRDPAFGYIVSRPDARRVVIDVFADPLGARWRKPGTPAPATAASRAASARPQTPAVSEPQRGRRQEETATLPPQAQTPAENTVTPNAATPPVEAHAPQAPSPLTRIPMPTPGRNGGDTPAATTLGRMAAAGSRAPEPSGARTTEADTAGRAVPQAAQSVSPEPAPFTGDPNSAAAREARALRSPAASGPVAPVLGEDRSLPSENDISTLTSRIEDLPPSVADSAFAWPDPNAPASAPAAQTALPPLGSAERRALERSLDRPARPAPEESVAEEPAPNEAAPRQPAPGESAPRVRRAPAPAQPSREAAEEAQPQVAGRTPTPPPGLSDIGSVRGSINRGVELPVESEPVVEDEPAEPTEPIEPAASTRPARRGEPAGANRAAAPSPANADRGFADAPARADRSAEIAPQASGGRAAPREQAAAPATAAPVASAAPSASAIPPVTDARPLDAASAPETRERMAEVPAGAKPEVIYVDEEGNQIPKPPDSPAMIADARKLLKDGQIQEAIDLLEEIKGHTLTPEQREDVLYMLSEGLEKLYADDWLQGYEPVVRATNEAMNFNLNSPRVADALMRLGMINLKTGNQSEAIGYFGALKNAFPLKPDVPVAYLALGRDQFDRGQYADAVRTFQLILDKYPESNAVREASRYMAEALYKQGHDKRALILVDFVNRRWPRLYLEDTDYLGMVGDLLNREKRLDDALQTYWTYYNLVPDNPKNDEILLRIGSLYMQMGFPTGAREVFEELLRKYPQSASAPVALRRLGENGIHDGNPTLEELFALFEQPSPTSPDIYYQKILDDYPDSGEASVAALRLAAWHFRNKDIAPAMTLAQRFLKEHPNSIYGPRAEEILRRGFEREFGIALEEENYDRILTLWDRYPEVRINYPTLNDDLRVALARAHLNRGEEEEGMDLLLPFLERPKDPTYGEYAYNLFLARALRREDWDGILDLGEKVADWDLPVPARAQLDYSRAISAENLGLAGRALPLWRALSARDDIPLYQKAYATYFMAREAERQRDLDEAYRLNLETLKLFTQLQDDRSDQADPERIRESLAALMDVTEVMNRFAESLDWADKYAAFVPKDSPDYAPWQFRVARLHRKMGDLGRWRALLDDIVLREPDSVYGRMAASELRTQEVARDLTRFTPE